MKQNWIYIHDSILQYASFIQHMNLCWKQELLRSSITDREQDQGIVYTLYTRKAHRVSPGDISSGEDINGIDRS